MKTQTIISEFFDRSIRVEKLIHIGTMCMDEWAWPSIARDAFEDDAEDVWEALGLEEPEIQDTSEWCEVLVDCRKVGFLIEFATPIPWEFSENSWSSPWSCYHTKWIYGDTFEEACEKALEWQEEFIESKRAKGSD